MAALAVDQHQGLVGAQPAQRRGAEHVGAVGDRRLREVERRHQLVENLVGLAQPGLGQFVAADDIDRHRRVGNRAVGSPGSGDDDRILRVSCSFRRGLVGRDDWRDR